MAHDWKLANIEQLDGGQGDEPSLPARSEREALVPGQLVGLVFEVEPFEHGTDPHEGVFDTGRVTVEQLWVEVLEPDGAGRYLGAVRDDPHAVPDLCTGDVITFGPEHVASISSWEREWGYPAAHTAVLDGRLRDLDVLPGIVYRNDAPADLHDSGWVLLLDGQQPDDSTVEALELRELVEHFPQLEQVFREGSGEWRWSDTTGGYTRAE